MASKKVNGRPGGEDEEGVNTSIIERSIKDLDLQTSSLQELQLAHVITRQRQLVTFQTSYASDDDQSDEDEEDGKVYSIREYHDSGQLKMYRTYTIKQKPDGSGVYQRMIEEKHFNPDGVCMLDVHFAIGQPYLSRKHYHPNQRLKSEKLFFIEDEVTMRARKTGYWRDYYDGGQVQAEIQYGQHGVRIGFAKRYGYDGSILWVKDYTKEYIDNMSELKTRLGEFDFSAQEACQLLGFSSFAPCIHSVNKAYRKLSMPLHPDKQGTVSEEMTEKFIELSRARDILKEYFEQTRVECECEKAKKETS
mmetsp:Transcript_9428/g.16375  ORF Transcript_9428/g.16375 Transcript_9428/m.16375 type:complete len:306 (-) Transcript_9428:84-1001(-)|eukprot:CAMPEP_0184693158 /NCGR_PEP_ID=MMETSP0313-20130426/1441_1 /TAXON_ID=2792 /ORGANISM="Porphyridium aerugineum, Strain SAG 1380-2" /LENGTH=305 /DNA_ID=CAMNT_0027151149 /DNA_START=153 /DNA_END=1070 /DNA_ORIENTATION=-